MTMLSRIKQLELANRPVGRVHWLSPTEPGQTRAEARAAYEAINGPIAKDDIVLSWNVFSQETSPCA